MKESGILASLDPGQRRLQEALFEIVSSEVFGGAWRFGLILIVSSKASYLKSLNVLVFHFAASAQFSAGSSILSSKDREVIFSNVLQVSRIHSEGDFFRFRSGTRRKVKTWVVLRFGPYQTGRLIISAPIPDRDHF